MLIQQRNPYLRRLSTETPHKYSYDMHSGKYKMLTQDGAERIIYKTGSQIPKFRKNFTGFASSKNRYELAQKDGSALHFAPNFSYNKHHSFYTPTTKKFVGYAQMPYQLKNKQIPQFLINSSEPQILKKKKRMEKAHTEEKSIKRKNDSIILQNATMTFTKLNVEDKYFQSSMISMSESKPLPKYSKKTCYNHRCKYLKQFTFHQKDNSEISTKFMTMASQTSNLKTLSKSFYDKQFENEKKQFATIQGLA